MAANEIVELDSRGRADLKNFAASHTRFLVIEEANGTLILRPDVDVAQDELALRDDSDLMEHIRMSRADPSRMRRGRPQAPEK